MTRHTFLTEHVAGFPPHGFSWPDTPSLFATFPAALDKFRMQWTDETQPRTDRPLRFPAR